jgi:hypothetical protein
MSLALYLSRVRSSEMLERTCRHFPKLTLVPWHYFSGASRPAATSIEGLQPKLMRRMPPLPQRRNRAYLNRAKDRARWPVHHVPGLAGAAGTKGVRCGKVERTSKGLCALTVELSGAHADV